MGELIHEFSGPEYSPQIPVVSVDREEGLEIVEKLENEEPKGKKTTLKMTHLKIPFFMLFLILRGKFQVVLECLSSHQPTLEALALEMVERELCQARGDSGNWPRE